MTRPAIQYSDRAPIEQRIQFELAGHVELKCKTHGWNYAPAGTEICSFCHAAQPQQPKESHMTKRQAALPGMERKTVKEVDTAAEHYVSARDTRMKHTEKEHDAKEGLIAAMKKHNLLSYRDDDAGLVVTLVSKDNVKVVEAESDEDAAEKLAG